jgi:osmotically-inducible protein OsmY
MADYTNLTHDEEISQAIERKIDAAMGPKASPINVAVEGATVTLTGHVANQATKDALIKIARSVDGVIDVTDNLVVREGHPVLDSLFPWRDQNRDLEDKDRGDW